MAIAVRSIRLFICLCLIGRILTSSLPAVTDDRDGRISSEQIASVVNIVKPALVRIEVVSADFDQGREIKEEAVGSGIIISKQGHVITNHHVAGHAKQITCTMSDKTEIDAELVGTDPLSDISVIKLVPSKKREFPFAKFGDSSKLRVGDPVLAMGSPLAFSQSVTSGIVSNTELVIPKQFGWLRITLDGEDVGSLVRWIAHDAPIYPGNSGGPLVNMRGEIVGINEIELGLSGAIPSNLARSVAEQIIKRGRVKRSWFGFDVQPLLKSTGYDKGVLVSGIEDNSPAQKGGLRAGDILIRIAGKDCSVRFREELPLFNDLVANLPIGEEIEAIVLRDRKEVALKITPLDRQEAMARPQELKQWGICASDLTSVAAKEMKRERTQGVLVNNVRPSGPAGNAKPAIQKNDVIVSVVGKPIQNLENLRRLTQEITSGKTDPVPTVVAFERGSDKYLTVVKIGIQEMKDSGSEVRKAWLPVSSQVLTRDIAEALGLKGQTGVRVTQVFPNTAADKAGLQVGDIIVALDEMPLSASEPEDTDVLPAIVRQYKIGSTVEFAVLRDSRKLKISVELPQAPKLPREMKRYRDNNFDFVARDIAFLDRVGEKWPETQQGALVESVSEGGWASLGGLSLGDLILSVDGQPIQNIADFEKIMKEIGNRKPKATVLQVRRGVHDTYLELEPSWTSE